MNKTTTALLLALLAVSSPGATASADDNQSDIRENPTVELGNTASAAVIYPSYIKLSSNHIKMNGADWSDLVEVFAAVDSCPVTIVHIGDSHLQADMGTAVTRTRLQSAARHDRGRGLIIPFKLAGTNQPVDYQITSTSPMTQSRLLKLPWPTAMGFSGISIEPGRRNFPLNISTRETFDRITIYYSGDTLEVNGVIAHGAPVPFYAGPGYKSAVVNLSDTVSSVELSLKAPAHTSIHGINCSRGDVGLAYHVIGNNGATFATYSMIGTVGEDVAEMFEPDLIILSLGTNEAFNHVDDSDFRRSIDNLVKELAMACPDARLLLVTPQECHIKVNRRRGRRRRSSGTAFMVNNNVKRMRDVILDYAGDNNIPVYDWYEVAGGAGSSHKWIADRNINTDHIHLTMSGYRLQGNLFTDALLEQLQPTR